MASGGQPDQQLTPERGKTGDSVSLVKPLFVKARDLPQSPVDYKTYELCRSCESVSGPQSMEGAQRIGGLWRLYPGNSQARLTLLLSGIELRGVHVALSDVNRFLLGASGQEVETSRLTVSDIPLSYSNKDIEDTFKRLGCILLSNLKYEHERDEKGKLTRWKTGRWFVYIETPAVPLQRDVKIGIFLPNFIIKNRGTKFWCATTASKRDISAGIVPTPWNVERVGRKATSRGTASVCSIWPAHQQPLPSLPWLQPLPWRHRERQTCLLIMPPQLCNLLEVPAHLQRSRQWRL